MNLKFLRRFIREQISRNFHSIDDSSYTFEDFQDYNAEINTDGKSDRFYLDIFYIGNKIIPTSSFSSHEEAVHASRLAIDKHRVRTMNTKR